MDRLTLYDSFGNDFNIYLDDTYDYEYIPAYNFKLPSEDWMHMYDLARKYYETYGDLKIVRTFKTKDGINYDPEGFTLGNWIENQRYAYKNRNIPKEKRTANLSPLSEEKEQKLREIGMFFDYWEDSWNFMYDLASKYYEAYGNLKINKDFKTKDGITYDKNGYTLGNWIQNQRKAYKNRSIPLDERKNSVAPLTEERENRLNKIDMIYSISKVKTLKK